MGWQEDTLDLKVKDHRYVLNLSAQYFYSFRKQRTNEELDPQKVQTSKLCEIDL